MPGQIVEESTSVIRGQLEDVTVTTRNLLDEDFDGIVDEDVNLHFTRRAQTLAGGIQICLRCATKTTSVSATPSGAAPPPPPTRSALAS